MRRAASSGRSVGARRQYRAIAPALLAAATVTLAGAAGPAVRAANSCDELLAVAERSGDVPVVTVDAGRQTVSIETRQGTCIEPADAWSARDMPQTFRPPTAPPVATSGDPPVETATESEAPGRLFEVPDLARQLETKEEVAQPLARRRQRDWLSMDGIGGALLFFVGGITILAVARFLGRRRRS